MKRGKKLILNTATLGLLQLDYLIHFVFKSELTVFKIFASECDYHIIEFKHLINVPVKLYCDSFLGETMSIQLIWLNKDKKQRYYEVFFALSIKVSCETNILKIQNFW